MNDADPISTDSRGVSLPPGFNADRVTHLATEDGTGHVGVFHLGTADGTHDWLYCLVDPENYPAWSVFTKTLTDAEMVAYLRGACPGWLIRKSGGLEGLGTSYVTDDEDANE